MTFKQNVVWIGTVLGDASINDFEEYFLNELRYHIRYVDEFKMESGYYQGLNCIIFSVCSNELPKFTLFRLTTTDMKWLEDFWDNECDNIPLEVYNKYKD